MELDGFVPRIPNEVVCGLHRSSASHSGWNPMSGSSDSYGKMVLSHLEKVEQLPPEVQVDIAKRVGTYFSLAIAAKTDELLSTLAAGAMQEQAKAIGQGVGSTMDPQWAGPALAEAWCYAKVSLSNGNLDQPSATAIITAIEGFVKKRASLSRSANGT